MNRRGLRRLLTALAVPALVFSTGGYARAVVATSTVTYHAGWNLVGGPEGTRYDGAEGALYTLQPSDDAYEVLAAGTPAVSGYGYWVYFPAARTVQLPAGTATASVQMQPGRWVTIGNPSGTHTAPVTGVDALYTWDPEHGYRAAASLQPGQGAWAYSQNGGLLTIGSAVQPGTSGSISGAVLLCDRGSALPSQPVGAASA